MTGEKEERVKKRRIAMAGDLKLKNDRKQPFKSSTLE